MCSRLWYLTGTPTAPAGILGSGRHPYVIVRYPEVVAGRVSSLAQLTRLSKDPCPSAKIPVSGVSTGP